MAISVFSGRVPCSLRLQLVPHLTKVAIGGRRRAPGASWTVRAHPRTPHASRESPEQPGRAPRAVRADFAEARACGRSHPPQHPSARSRCHDWFPAAAAGARGAHLPARLRRGPPPPTIAGPSVRRAPASSRRSCSKSSTRLGRSDREPSDDVIGNNILGRKIARTRLLVAQAARVRSTHRVRADSCASHPAYAGMRAVRRCESVRCRPATRTPRAPTPTGPPPPSRGGQLPLHRQEMRNVVDEIIELLVRQRTRRPVAYRLRLLAKRTCSRSRTRSASEICMP